MPCCLNRKLLTRPLGRDLYAQLVVMPITKIRSMRSNGSSFRQATRNNTSLQLHLCNMSTKAKKSVSLSLPAAARRSKKSTKQANPRDSQPEQGHSLADMQLLAALMDAPPGAVISITDGPPAQVHAENPAHAGADEPIAMSAQDAAAAAVSVAGAAEANAVAGHLGAAATAAEAAQPAAEPDAMEVEATAEPHDADGHQQEPAATFSDQTLVQKAVAASPTVQCTGKRSRRACSNKAQQLLQELGDSDDEAADGPSSEEKPAGRRSKKAKRYEDSDFEMDGPSSSSDEGSDGAASVEDDDFDLDEEEDEGPKKKKGKGKAAAAKGKKQTAADAGTAKGAKKPSARARASTGSVANTAGAGAGSGRGSVKAGSQRTSLGSAMPSVGPAGRKKASGRGASGMAAAASSDVGCGTMHAPAARMPLPGGLSGAGIGSGAMSGSSCAVGRPRSGAAVQPSSLKAVPAAAAAGDDAEAAQQQQQQQQQEQGAAAMAAGQLGVLSDDGCDKENAAAPGGDGDAGGATLKAAGSLPAANQAVTAVSSAGVRPAASAVSCKGPGLARGLNKGGAGAKLPGSSPAGSSLTGGFKSPLHNGATSSRDTGSTCAAAAAAAAAAPSRGLGGLGAAMGRGSQLTGMFGGAAYKVSGLRRPAKK